MNRPSPRTLIAFVVVLAAPVLSGPAQAGQPAHRDLIRVQQKSPEDPWLRINAGGHTGTVQALAFTPDSKRLCSAGLDKNVLVWNLTAMQRDLRRSFLRERTIRWQVARGLRGSLYALAVAPSDGLLAFGGYGAMGSLGEILVVDPVTGALAQVLQSHRQTVCSLAFSADGNCLVSSDTAGQVTRWTRDGWQPTVLVRPDETTYGAAAARTIAVQPKLRPVAIAGDDVAIPAYQSRTAGGSMRWKLNLMRLDNPQQTRLLDTMHEGLVTSLAASPDGTRLASADLQGHVFVWELAGAAVPPPTVLDVQPCALSLAFSPDGKTLVAGTAVAPGSGQSQLQIWDLADRGTCVDKFHVKIRGKQQGNLHVGSVLYGPLTDVRCQVSRQLLERNLAVVVALFDVRRALHRTGQEMAEYGTAQLRRRPGGLAGTGRIQHGQVGHFQVAHQLRQTLGESVVQDSRAPVAGNPAAVQDQQFADLIRHAARTILEEQ
jgi:hypothetical protein